MSFNRGSNTRNSGRGSTVGIERHGSIHTLDDAKALQVYDASDVDKLIKSIKNSRKSADTASSNKRDWGANSLQSPGMIAPDSKLRLRWDGVTMVMIILSCVLHPIQMAWPQQFQGGGGGWIAFDLLVCGWFVLTVLLNFRTGILDNGVTLINPQVVARTYATGWLVVDLLAALPVFSLGDVLGAAATTDNGSIVIQILGILKLLRISQGSRLLGQLGMTARFNPSLLRLLRLVVTIVLLWHWTACMWWLIGTSTPDEHVWQRVDASSSSSWGLDPILLTLNPWSQYLYSFYWSISVLTGLGAVPPPSSNGQTIFHVILLILKLILQAIVISQATSILANMDAANMQRRRKLDALLEYLRKRNVPFDLCKRVAGYYEFLWARVHTLNEKELLNDLPSSLQLQVALVLNRTLFTRVPIFRDMEAQCIAAFVRRLRPLVCMPHQLVVKQGTKAIALCFISQGVMQSTKSKNGVLLPDSTDLLFANDFFGEESIVHDKESTITIRSMTYCELNSLHKEDYDYVLRRFPFLQTLVMHHANKLRENLSKRRQSVFVNDSSGGSKRRMSMATSLGAVPGLGGRRPSEVAKERACFSAMRTSCDNSQRTSASNSNRNSIEDPQGSFSKGNSLRRMLGRGNSSKAQAPAPASATPFTDLLGSVEA